MKHVFYVAVAIGLGVEAWLRQDQALLGFSIGVVTMVCLYNLDPLATAIARLIDRVTGYR